MSEFRIKLITKDGSVIQNRLGDKDSYVYKDVADLILKRDCCEKGVRLVSYTQDATGVTGIVDYIN